MGNPLDYSKLSDEELAAIQSHDYSKLSDSTLQALSEDDSHGAPIADVEHEMIPMPKMSAPGVGTGAAIIAGGAKTLKAVKPYLPERLGGTPAGQSSSSLQRYLNGSLQDNGMKPVPLSRLSQVTGMPVRSTSEIQAAVDAIKAVPGERIPVKKLVDGVEKIVRYDTIPAREAANLESPLIKALPNVGKYIEPVVRNAGKVARFAQGPLAIGAVVDQAQDVMNRKDTDPTGAVISGIGGIGAAASPWFPPAAAVPAAAMAINYARDNPDYVAKYKNPKWVPKFSGGGLAEGGESNTAPFIGYPHITNKPRDPNFVQQSGPILGGLDAVLGMGKRDDVSMLTPQGQAYHESYDKYEPVGIAGNVLPFMGGPTKAVGKAALRELGPKAAGMAENYLTKIGGIAHAVPPDTRIMRASEALGPHEGKWLNTTQSDRMRSTEGDLGGPGFSRFQQTDPAYKDAAWGVGQQATASGITNINKKYPEGQAIWSPMIGSETQHHSNQHVHDALTNEFNRQASLGNLPPELRAQMNARLTQYPEYAELFKKGIDVGNPESLKQMGDTFDRRSAISSVISGKGVGGTKGQIFDYPGIMQQMTDPMTIGSPTHSVGTRLFTLNNQVEHRPDLHSAFPYILKGQDQGVAFNPVPKELAIPDWLNLVREFKGREPGYMDYTRGLKGKGTPNQFISEEYLRNLESAGHAEGGSITGYAPGGKVLSALGKSLGEAQAAYKAKFTPDFYHASPSNKIKAFDTQAERNPSFLTALEEFL